MGNHHENNWDEYLSNFDTDDEPNLADLEPYADEIQPYKYSNYKRRRNYKRIRNRTIIITCGIAIAALLIFLISSLMGALFGGADKAAAKTSETLAASSEISADNAAVKITATEAVATTEKVTGPVTDEFFDHTVFVGDSISVGLSLYVEGQRNAGNKCLGNSYVLASGSLGYINAQTCPVGNSECKLPLYKGVQQSIEDSIADLKADRVYILLGMNDVALSTPEEYVSYVKIMTDNIKAKSPNIKICLESVTPRIAGNENEDLNNTSIKEHNAKLEEFANANNYSYLNLYDVVCDENGNLKDEYCGDPNAMGLHFSSTGLEQLVSYYYQHPDGI